MMNDSSFEIELQRIIKRLESNQKLWEERRSETEHQLEIISSRLEFYKAILEDYRRVSRL